jgi:peroxiredoxin
MPAPDFSAVTTTGQTFSLSANRGKVVVLFFFPKAFTPGCSKEASDFARSWHDFEGMGAEVIGISTDEHQTQCDFAGQLKLPFALIADTDAKISHQYGATWPLLDIARRYTFVIDAGGLVQNVFKHELRVGKHASGAQAAVKKLQL